MKILIMQDHYYMTSLMHTNPKVSIKNFPLPLCVVKMKINEMLQSSDRQSWGR